MVTYASSKFLSPSPIDLSDEKVEKIFESVHDLKSVNKITTTAEMQRMLDEHFFNLTTGSVEVDSGEYTSLHNEKASVVKRTENTIEQIFEAPAITARSSSSDDLMGNSEDETTDEKLKKLLEDL